MSHPTLNKAKEAQEVYATCDAIALLGRPPDEECNDHWDGWSEVREDEEDLTVIVKCIL